MTEKQKTDAALAELVNSCPASLNNVAAALNSLAARVDKLEAKPKAKAK